MRRGVARRTTRPITTIREKFLNLESEKRQVWGIQAGLNRRQGRPIGRTDKDRGSSRRAEI